MLLNWKLKRKPIDWSWVDFVWLFFKHKNQRSSKINPMAYSFTKISIWFSNCWMCKAKSLILLFWASISTVSSWARDDDWSKKMLKHRSLFFCLAAHYHFEMNVKKIQIDKMKSHLNFFFFPTRINIWSLVNFDEKWKKKSRGKRFSMEHENEFISHLGTVRWYARHRRCLIQHLSISYNPGINGIRPQANLLQRKLRHAAASSKQFTCGSCGPFPHPIVHTFQSSG